MSRHGGEGSSKCPGMEGRCLDNVPAWSGCFSRKCPDMEGRCLANVPAWRGGV